MKFVRVSSYTVLVLGLAVVSAPIVATAKSITVKPGQSIQAAVNGAKAGDTVKVLSGDYVLASSQLELDADWGQKRCAAVLIHKPITLMASGQVRIVAPQSQVPTEGCQVLDGIVAEGTADKSVDGVEIKGFTVQGFTNNGIKLRYVKNFNIENNVSIDNLENGIWPTLSANGQVKKNVAYGSVDSALWIEASQNVRVFNNDLSTSPTGLEVTLSKNVVMANNNVHDNTVGIGLYHPAAAGLPQELWPDAPYGNWQVANNNVHDNNMANPLAGEGGEVAQLPPGLGMLILGVQHVDVRQNWVEKNGFVGVALMDWCVAAAGDCFAEGFPSTTLPPGFEDTALSNVRVVANKFAGNHTATDFLPNVPPELQALKSDILYVDGTALPALIPQLPPLPPGTDNCQSDNKLIKTPNPHDPGVLMYTVPPEALIGVDLFPTCP